MSESFSLSILEGIERKLNPRWDDRALKQSVEKQIIDTWFDDECFGFSHAASSR